MLLWKYRKNRCAQNLTIFKNYTKRLKTIMKLSQKARNNFTINMARNKSKATWNIINNNKVNKRPNTDIRQIIYEDKILTHPNDIVEAFNNYYVNQVISTNIKPFTDLQSIVKSVNWNKSNSIFMCPSTPEDILKIIKSLKNTNSTGYDEITTKVIKHVALIISPLLSHIINLCIDCGMFPENLKLSIINTLFKKQDREIINNYRPVALVPIFSKIFEKYIYAGLYTYLDKYNILIEEQLGFRKKKSINMAIYNLIKTVRSGREKKLPVYAMYMDLKKAFDYVDHDILIGKLEKYGIRGNVLNLIKSYLSNRSQQTQITKICLETKTEQKYTSSPGLVKYGVPQGSVLGPLLFIIYINDLPQAIAHPMILYADDSTAIFVGEKEKQSGPVINLALKNIIKWLTSNNLIINLDKTNIMTFNKNIKLTSKITYLNNDIHDISVTRFLGLYVDSDLNWKMHAESVRAKLNSYSYALYLLSKVVSQPAVIISYHAYVTSTLRYGIIFWGNCTERETLFKAQKKCLRSVCHLKSTDSCKPHFLKLKILTFPCLYIFEMALFVRNNFQLFEFNKRERHKNKINIPPHRTAGFTKGVCGMAPKIYNHLPRIILESESVNIFKSKLFNFLILKSYYTINEYLNDKISNFSDAMLYGY